MTTENKKANIREYQIRAGLTDTFGRLICNTRHHHFVVDGPAHHSWLNSLTKPAWSDWP
jgi:hypothetical protein